MAVPTAAVHRPKSKQQQQQHHATISSATTKNKFTKGGGSGGINLQFVTGLLIGFVIALGLCIMMVSVTRVVESNNNNSEKNGVGVKEPPKQEDPPGWKSIHVFFHDENAGLKLTGDSAMDPKWFAQVHQDEIVVDLLGTQGYFIDLASNDAKQFSNTLALERNGLQWQGLCIEPNPSESS
jgi:hypothetical protein